MKSTFLFLVVLGISLSTISCAHREGGLSERLERTPDQALAAEITRRLEVDPVTTPLRLGVQANNGVVTLNGRIDQPAVRLRAIGLAESVEGVTRVIDQTVRF